MSGTMFAKKRLSALVRLGALIGLALSSSVHAQAPTNDPLSAQQWNLKAIRVPQAWALAPASGEKVRIAIIDSGYSGHPDIQWAKDGGDRSLYRDTYYAGDGVQAVGVFPHGTHVAGIIAARTGNGAGIAGICPQCEILSIKVSSPASDQDIAIAIGLAVQEGARVINMSMAEAGKTCSSNPRTQKAIAAALLAGVPFVTSAGNHNGSGIKYENGAPDKKSDVAEVSPASCPEVISVGATDQLNLEAAYSNDGPTLTLMAPGGGVTPEEGVYGAVIGGCPGATNEKTGGAGVTTLGVLSAWVHHNGAWSSCYRYLSGTSMSAPHVAGVVGLMLSVNPALTPSQVRSVLQGTATSMACANNACGAGLLNAEAAVNAARALSGGATAAGACRYNFGYRFLVDRPCTFDTMAEAPGGGETVTAYGHVWRFDTQGKLLGKLALLSSSSIYAGGNGPCSPQFISSAEVCAFETRTEVNYPGVGYLESITAYGRYWNFDANGQPFGPQGASLNSVARYAAANGPCYQKNPCVFDTRSLVVFPEWGGLVESVNAYGQYWMWDANGNLLASGPLQSVARYQQICNYGPAGTPCKFDTRELKSNRHEVITAYGRYFEFNGEALIQNTALADMPRFN
ncbi:S8 family peptidase [Xanthomonas sacchari]